MIKSSSQAPASSEEKKEAEESKAEISNQVAATETQKNAGAIASAAVSEFQ